MVVWESVPTRDTRGRRHDAEVVEGLLAPLQEFITLLIALEFAFGVDLESHSIAEGIDLDRVVDHEVDVDQRVDLGRIAADFIHRIPHRGQVDHRGNPGEVLHQDPGGLEGDLNRRFGRSVPGSDRFDVGRAHRGAVLETQHVFEEDLDRVRQTGHVELRLQCLEAVDLVGLSAYLEFCPCSE